MGADTGWWGKAAPSGGGHRFDCMLQSCGGALAACLAVDAVSVNFAFQETSVGIHYNAEDGTPVELQDYLLDRSVFAVDAEGFMALPSAPGLGIALDEAKVRAMAAMGHKWKDREWTLADGTPTTW